MLTLGLDGRMRKGRFGLVLFVLLVFSLSLAVPAEDVPETPYDESEGLPYQSIPLFSIGVSQATPEAQDVQGSIVMGTDAPSPLVSTRINDQDAARSSTVRDALALSCILRC